MSITWGSWEYGGGNGMRVGIEVTWSAVTISSTEAVATVDIWTDNQYNYADPQKLSFGGAIDGSKSFTNSSGSAAQQRATRTYERTYGSSEYVTSPGKVTFTASLSGAYNGVTPSVSVSSSIPARPAGVPAAPTSVVVARVNDGAQRVTWKNRSTSAAPWTSVTVDRSVRGGAWQSLSSQGGAATGLTDQTTEGDSYYRYRVRASGVGGTTSWVETATIYTTPAPPLMTTRTPIYDTPAEVAYLGPEYLGPRY